FACPFLKHNEARCRHPKWSCCWHGWPTVHRVKEHLYRRHMLPRYQCNRCYEDLGSLASFTEHQRLPVPCQLRDLAQREGIDEDQERRLRSKRRTKRKPTEEEKWVDVYGILFPGDELIPSPYQSLLFTEESSRGLESGRTILERFEVFAQNEFPRRMRPHVGGLVDRAVEQALTPETLTNAFGTVLQSILRSFRESNTSPNNHRDNTNNLDAPQQLDITSGASVHIGESAEAPASRIHNGGWDEAPAADIDFLANMVDQIPGQELEFDFDTFLSSLDEN
ncbi:hypothetical protein EDB81DRAFT_657399, partial [Dactylonectria macrodidyma]